MFRKPSQRRCTWFPLLNVSVNRCLVFVCVRVRVAHFSLAMMSARSASVRFGSFRDSLQPSSSMSIKADMATSAVTPLSTGGADKAQPVSWCQTGCVMIGVPTRISHGGLTSCIRDVLELFHGYPHAAGRWGGRGFARWRLAAFRHGDGVGLLETTRIGFGRSTKGCVCERNNWAANY